MAVSDSDTNRVKYVQTVPYSFRAVWNKKNNKMNKDYITKPIGYARCSNGGFAIQIEKKYREALRGLSEFGHINVVWWFSECDNDEQRNILTIKCPYKGSPEKIGTFATRSPERPNPIAFTVCEVLSVDEEKGEIQVSFLDAMDGTPILDIKPYTPSFDRVERPMVPKWQAQWPQSIETSGTFDWSSVFNF